METISVILSLICLIVFFVMASNISAIKNQVKRNYNKEISAQDYYNMYKEEKYLENKDKAKEYLLRAMYRYKNNQYISPQKKEKFLKDCEEELNNL